MQLLLTVVVILPLSVWLSECASVGHSIEESDSRVISRQKRHGHYTTTTPSTPASASDSVQGSEVQNEETSNRQLQQIPQRQQQPSPRIMYVFNPRRNRRFRLGYMLNSSGQMSPMLILNSEPSRQPRRQRPRPNTSFASSLGTALIFSQIFRRPIGG